MTVENEVRIAPNYSLKSGKMRTGRLSGHEKRQ